MIFLYKYQYSILKYYMYFSYNNHKTHCEKDDLHVKSRIEQLTISRLFSIIEFSYSYYEFDNR